jgi:HD-GYP domain-containing protein (c-di-GMP phosphodiesterase class II)
MFEYADTLDALNKNIPVRDKLVFTHNALKEKYDFIDRIAIAIYDPKTELVKTYIDSSGNDHPLEHYQATLDQASTLREIIKHKRPLVINDLEVFNKSSHEHTQRIKKQGYSASYTMPMYYNDVFFGFIFFNSYQKESMQPEVLHYLDLFGHMISLMIINELSALRTLVAAVETASNMTHQRDTETGTHLDRMSSYARIIARHLATSYDLDDEYIEHIFMFSPLHDIGKITIPDNIMLKPGKLDSDEFDIMKTHSIRGREIIDTMLHSFGLDALQHIDILRNIAEFHHESMDGSGYPQGLREKQIPLESRITAVADVFDALTSQRPYKAAWSNDEAFAMLQKMAGSKLDQDCVDALLQHREEIEAIQVRFHEDQFGLDNSFSHPPYEAFRRPGFTTPLAPIAASNSPYR